MPLTDALDTLLDRSIVLGYTRIGPALRRHWWPADPQPGAMQGRRVLVTGATSGIGKATAAGLARLGAHVHVHGHRRDHLDQAMADLRAEAPNGEFEAEMCDLSDLEATRRFAEDLAGRIDRLDALVHNAGTMAPDRRETPQGHEFTLAVMVLAPQLLTSILTERLAAADAPIVTYMSSGGMYAAALRDDDPEYRTGKYSGAKAYARAKRMQVVLAWMWAQRLASRGIAVHSMHPGWVNTRGVAHYLPKFRAVTLPFMRDPAGGADTMIWLVATRPDAHDSWHFWHDRRLRPTSYGRAREQGVDKRQRLWDYVADATGTPGWDEVPD